MIGSFLSNRTQHVVSNGIISNSSISKCGVPQGSTLGPLLFSVFINDLPIAITSSKVETDLFADDGTLHAADKNINVINSELQLALSEVAEWCSLNDMIMNPSKTESMIITTRQKHQLEPLLLRLAVDDVPVKQVDEHRLLGVIVDTCLSWQNHIDMTCKTLSRYLYALSRLKHITNESTRKIFYEAHIRSRIDYASTLWDGCSENLFKKLSSLYRRSAKNVSQNCSLTTDQKLMSLNMLPLKQHLLLNKSIFMFKHFSGYLPPYLIEILPKIKKPKYATSRCTISMPGPIPRIDLVQTSLCYSGGVLWENLPTEVTNARSLTTFKRLAYRYFSETAGY